MAPSAPNKGNMVITLEGRGKVTLRPTDYIASGGEGSLYHISDMAVKLFLDMRKVKERKTIEKISRLMKLSHPYIVAPRGLALDAQGNPVGYHMPYIDNPPAAYPLSQVFTNDIWQLEKINPKKALILVERMREVVDFAHAEGAILVDPNEMNWFGLKFNREPEPRIVDVDSWVLGPMPPTVAVMPSVRDWHRKTFDELSDWFSWGVVTFQVLTGIHPYKGTLDGFDRGDIEARMKASASVFTPGVRLNRAVRDFSIIPKPLLGWYEALFQKGERSVPPSSFDAGQAAPPAAKVLRAVAKSHSETLVFEKILDYPGDSVVRVFFCGVALLSSGQLIDLTTKRTVAQDVSSQAEVIKSTNGWVIGQIKDGRAHFIHISESNLKKEELSLHVAATRLFSSENRLFALNDNGLIEIKTISIGSRTLVSAGKNWSVMRTTKFFQSLGILDALGSKFILLPFDTDSMAQIRVKELDELSIVAGKANGRFASVIGLDKSGNYHKFEFAFEKEHSSYGIWSGAIDNSELNIAILPKGVCATIVSDGELTIFVPSNGSSSKIKDKSIGTDMLLTNYGDKVVYVQNGKVWSLRMRQ